MRPPAPGSLRWLARHELRLSWRDWQGLMGGGRSRRSMAVALAVLAYVVVMHLVALGTVKSFAPSEIAASKTTFIVATASAILFWSLMLSQAIEMVTRAFYARADLEIILSSPVQAARVFTVRIAAIALSATFISLPIAAPFINALAWVNGPRWLGTYAVFGAMGACATALAVTLTVFLFRTLGPKRTRFVAQVVAAIVGATFVIGIQAAAILSTGTLSRMAVIKSQALHEAAPGPESIVWLPARAMMGDPQALVLVLFGAVAILAMVIELFSMRFADYATAAAGASVTTARQSKPAPFRPMSAVRTLRRKEWLLLKRDPWLVSQTLMQILYLIPPALLLWRNFGESADTLAVMVPVVVMAAGQLAGGLAWLVVSGEDAPDLVASAPVPPSMVIRAKIEAVMGAIALVVTPLVLVLGFTAPVDALVTLFGVILAAGSATLIQLWFRTQAKRSQFRRRQTSSKVATFAEAFSSISWAGAAGLAAAGTWLALVPGTAACLLLIGVRAVRSR